MMPGGFIFPGGPFLDQLVSSIHPARPTSPQTSDPVVQEPQPPDDAYVKSERMVARVVSTQLSQCRCPIELISETDDQTR